MSNNNENHAHTTLPSVARFVWMDRAYMPLSSATVPITAHSLHYGTAVFEGIRFYETDKGPAVFRLQDHIYRLFASANAMSMRLEHDEDELTRVVCELIRRNNLADGYVRMIAYYGDGISLTRDDLQTHIAIFLLPWPSKKMKPIRLQISKFRKSDPRTIIHRAKVAGHYVNSYLAASSFDQSRYDGALMLDCDGWVAETTVANIFSVKDSILFTPKPGSILPGITRDTVLKLAQSMSIQCIESNVSMDHLKHSDEVFITGTASEVIPVKGIDEADIGEGAVGHITSQLSNAFNESVRGRNSEFLSWLTRA
ncbi:MAG: branched-chain-amino-acid transaminase [Parcubacteria group bacterium CG1_02_41_12]|nr:MAG: branched-chain-amino-acid transaminase [Parcubacteria group bacterium CG1_02_41_12]